VLTDRLKRTATRRDCRCRRTRHRHGTRGAYNRDQCRCDPCTAANAAAARRHRLCRAQQAWHGTSAWSPAVGTRRRLQVLTAAGWTTSQLADRMGVSKSAIAQLRNTGQDRVLATTAGDVAALYDACWWRTPPGRYQARAERYAETRGWVAPWRWDGLDLDDPATEPHPPAADVDQVAIDETIAGRQVPLTKTERRAVADQLHRRGASAAEIASRLGRTPRTVERHKAAARAQLQGAA
jgi:transposase